MGVTKRIEGFWMIAVLASIYLNGELGHYLIGVVSREMAQELHFGSKACFPMDKETPIDFCQGAASNETCESLHYLNETQGSSCKWDYDGLGLDYQLLAGPSFMAVFTIAGVLWGFAADKCNRVTLLFFSTILFSLSLAGTALATAFWHLVLCRVFLGVGVSACSPLAAGMICDTFHQQERGKAMSVYNCGMYIGYGLSYAVGIYVTQADIFGMGWRATFVICGIPGLFLALMLITTVKDPASTGLVYEDKAQKEASYISYEAMHSVSVNRRDYEEIDPILLSESGSYWEICFQPVIVLLILAACLRRSAGYTLRYNSALYFQVYFPDYDVGWPLTIIYLVGGVAGSMLGGITSDRLVNKLGVSARALVLGVGQLIATPFAVAQLYLDPPYCFIPQFIGYLFGAMWFGALFTILVELVPASIRSTAFGIAFFVMENVGGNFPVLIDYLTSKINYRAAITILYPGELIASSAMFFACYCLLHKNR